jgi:hypothetical protein
MAAFVGAAACPLAARAQPELPSRVHLTFNHYYNYPEMVEALKQLETAYPELLALRTIGKSYEGRDMWLTTINNPKTGADRDKPAIYIDANVHGNELQGAETALYTIWYLTKSYGKVEKLTKLIDERAFYILQMVNPDGRANWFDNPNSPHSSRSGKQPTDNDYDGLFDEDGPDDLDGDGSITQMWKPDPNGRWRRSNRDPRIFERVPADEKGDFTYLGEEGIDNDGDGLVNEDGPGGYDMNRNWPADWQPDYIQHGAGEYPFAYPETRAIGEFILDHPNIAAVQSYHNAGGMILRGPGMKYREPEYPREDVGVYDEIGRTGEQLLPFYHYWVIYKDLYSVHGGFVTWTYEGLGIFSFTNEQWSDEQYYDAANPQRGPEARFKFGDLLQFGQVYTELKPYRHPQYGDILIGGWTKYSERVAPSFLLEGMCHRNSAFTLYHADQMPKLSFSRVDVAGVGSGVWSVTVEVRNDGAIPTISGVARNRRIAARDEVKLAPGPAAGPLTVVASGTLADRFTAPLVLTERSPERIWTDSGIPGHDARLFRWIVSGRGPVTVTYRSQKGGTITRDVDLSEPPG